MIHINGFKALLDANVLFPAPIRDILLHLASVELYKPKWTDEIQEEWIRNLLLKRTDLKRESLLSARDAMNAAFPDANITKYESLISNFTLPDKEDRHILAAAVKDKVDVIITFNIKDFPAEILKAVKIAVLHPDDFIYDLIQLDESKAKKAFMNQVKMLKNPPKTEQEVLAILSKGGLDKSAGKLQGLLVD